MEKIVKLTNNPLGIIGTFLTLVEGIAGLVIVKSQLKDCQNTILVIFVVLFPIIVLCVFYRLVTKHHEKLYSPSDYKDERNFVKIYDNQTKKMMSGNLDEKYSIQIEEIKNSISELHENIYSIIEMQNELLIKNEDEYAALSDDNEYIDIKEYLSSFSKRDLLEYNVEISRMKGCYSLRDELESENYEARIYTFDNNSSEMLGWGEHAAIWLGDYVPLEMAIEVIKIAKKHYSFLQYIMLSDGTDGSPEYIRKQIFIGGSTSTSKERGLKKLSNEDFEHIYDSTNIDELHSLIKSFEPYKL